VARVIDFLGGGGSGVFTGKLLLIVELEGGRYRLLRRICGEGAASRQEFKLVLIFGFTCQVPVFRRACYFKIVQFLSFYLESFLALIPNNIHDSIDPLNIFQGTLSFLLFQSQKVVGLEQVLINHRFFLRFDSFHLDFWLFGGIVLKEG